MTEIKNRQLQQDRFFLESLAGYVQAHFGDDPGRVCVVTPNRRSGIYLKKHLANLSERPLWAPEIYSIQDFMTFLSGMVPAEQVHLITHLYAIHRDMEGAKAQSFEEFLSWGGQLLTDFADIDLNLADADGLFGYLDEVKAMKLWNPDNQPLTEFQQNYLRFYQSLGEYYTRFTDLLVSRNSGHQGLIFRTAVERLRDGAVQIPWEKVLFAGFNALTRSEEVVFQRLSDTGQAVMFWDADRFYLDQRNHEAGMFLRRWAGRWSQADTFQVSDIMRTGNKDITIIGAPDIIGQVKHCGEILQRLGPVAETNAAVVLPDERLLLPLLNSLPGNVGSFNVTMGFPLRKSPLAGLLDLVFTLHLHAASMQPHEKKITRFYYRDIIRILNHPLINRFTLQGVENDHFAVNDLLARLKTGGKVFFTREELCGPGLFTVSSEILNALFSPWSSAADAIRDLQAITNLSRTEPIESEAAFVVARILHQLESVMVANESWITLPSLYQFYRQLVASQTLPFVGEPLKGLQIMGMLETRTLDFENLIILSCNEGLLPSGKTIHSFIPYDIRFEYGLPTYLEKDAVFSYHFYRLLQRASNVWLLYSTVPDKLGGGEMSRYLRQVVRELPAYNNGIKVHEQLLAAPMPRHEEDQKIVISKKGVVMDQLLKKTAAGLSPTALNNFRACSLKFYMSEIVRIREPEETGDTIDGRVLGNAVHHALFQLYEPFRGKKLTAEILEGMVAGTEAAVQQAFAEKFRKAAVNYGKNYLLVRVASLMIGNFLKSEMRKVAGLAQEGAQLTPVLLEQAFWRELEVQLDDKPFTVRIKGFIDRADESGNQFDIIDYKTGKVDPKKLEIRSWADFDENPGMDMGFQLLIYAWLMSAHNRREEIRAGIVSLRQTSGSFYPVSIAADTPDSKGSATASDFNAALSDFGDYLKRLVEKILDPDTTFSQTTNPENCRNCLYINFCGRQ